MLEQIPLGQALNGVFLICFHAQRSVNCIFFNLCASHLAAESPFMQNSQATLTWRESKQKTRKHSPAGEVTPADAEFPEASFVSI